MDGGLGAWDAVVSLLFVFYLNCAHTCSSIQTANQLHYVITPEDSIVLGGHSFVTPALQQSAVSIYHQFVAGYDITNNENMKEAFLLLSAIVAFFHEKLVVNQVEFGQYQSHPNVTQLNLVYRPS
jgi:hypothetical protein